MRKNLFFALALAMVSFFCSINSYAQNTAKWYDYKTCKINGVTYEIGVFIRDNGTWEDGVKACCDVSGACHKAYYSSASGESGVIYNLASIAAKYNHTGAFVYFTKEKGIPFDEWGIDPRDYTTQTNLKKTFVKGFTPLMYAVRNNNIPFVKYLIDLGADPRKVNRQGKTALDYAREKGNHPIITMLAEYAVGIKDEDIMVRRFNNSLLSLKDIDNDKLLSELGFKWDFKFENYI